MSIETMNESVSTVSESNDPSVLALVMSLLDIDLDVIQKLDDEPNDVGGLSAAELKAKFDEAPNLIKKYINETLIPQLSDTVAEAEVRAAAESERQSNEFIRVQAENEREAAESAREVWVEYNPATTYVPGNKVSYNGSSYVNVVSCTGTAPTDPSCWLLIAAKGAKGDKGDPGTGDGDMKANVYDPQGKATDIFAYAAPATKYGTTDVEEGAASPYPEGTLYVVLEG